MVNDVSGGMDPAMLPVIGATSVLYACMYSCWDAPHQFGSGAGGDTVPAIRRFFAERVATLHAHGLTNEQIVLDPGMGAFLGTDSSVSLAVIDAIPQLCEIYSPLLIGVSRKRFLSSLVDTLVSDRDQRSALVARRIAHACPTDAMLYVRVHAIEPHVEQFLVDDSVNIEMS
jgi:dihydropteroate synthase